MGGRFIPIGWRRRNNGDGMSDYFDSRIFHAIDAVGMCCQTIDLL